MFDMEMAKIARDNAREAEKNTNYAKEVCDFLIAEADLAFKNNDPNFEKKVEIAKKAGEMFTYANADLTLKVSKLGEIVKLL